MEIDKMLEAIVGDIAGSVESVHLRQHKSWGRFFQSLRLVKAAEPETILKKYPDAILADVTSGV